jgi:Rrf2 family protein
MNFSAKTEYACSAMLELAARHQAGEPVRIKDIADRHGIPSRFLVQILLQLKGAGFVTSTRGAAGGYQLAREPQAISLGDIIEAVEGPLGPRKSNAADSTPTTRILHETWSEIAEVQRRMLQETSLADLAERLRSKSDGMYYI